MHKIYTVTSLTYFAAKDHFQVFLKNLTDCHDESLQCCCHTITRSRLKLFESLVM